MSDLKKDQSEIMKLANETRLIAVKACPEAFQTVVSILSTPLATSIERNNAQLRLSAAREILDRGIGNAPQPIHQSILDEAAIRHECAKICVDGLPVIQKIALDREEDVNLRLEAIKAILEFALGNVSGSHT